MQRFFALKQRTIIVTPRRLPTRRTKARLPAASTTSQNGSCLLTGLCVAIAGLVSLGKCAGGSVPEPSPPAQLRPIEATGTPDQKPPATPEVGSPAFQRTMYVSARELNCRADEGSKSRIVATIPGGSAVIIQEEAGTRAMLAWGKHRCWAALQHLSTVFVPVQTAPRQFTTNASPARKLRPAAPSRSCGSKRYCGEMNTCEEATYYYEQCGVSRLDGDSDGTPCESIC